MRRETLETWMGSCVVYPVLGWTAWGEQLIWPAAFIFWGVTVWFLAGKIIGWRRDP